MPLLPLTPVSYPYPPFSSEAQYSLYSTLVSLIDRLDSFNLSRAAVLPWGAPVPAFGDPSASLVATLGLNPSNREFLDLQGNELTGVFRRFHTLRSLELRSWREVHAYHLRLILRSCCDYFYTNPYSRWFKPLDAVIAGLGMSYYSRQRPACHLDVVPYATSTKWGSLSPPQRMALLQLAGTALPALLRASPVRVLILNGHSVVRYFQMATGICLAARAMPAWSLPRATGRNVRGIAYRASVQQVGGLGLDRELLVLGFNHNLQSSFGVTAALVKSIRHWIATMCREVCP